MINPEIYLKAAVEVSARMTTACGAIGRAASLSIQPEDNEMPPELDLFGTFFRPDTAGSFGLWFGMPYEDGNQEDRVTALLLMYEIAKDMVGK